MENIELSIPLTYLIVYTALTTVDALLERFRSILVVSYLFVFYMGYIHNRILIKEGWSKGSPVYIGLYFTFGAIIIILAITTILKGDLDRGFKWLKTKPQEP